jgi:hypothetical protein
MPMTLNAIAPAEPAAIMIPALFHRMVDRHLAIAHSCHGLAVPASVDEGAELRLAATAILLNEMYVAGNA